MDDNATATLESQTATKPLTSRLGRGLNALIGGAEVENEAPMEAGPDDPAGDQLRHIPVAAIEPNPFQPRNEFEPEAIAELAESIKQHGMLQPLLLRPQPEGDGYQLVAGERRWLAAKQAGLETVACQVLELEDKSVYEVAIEENLKRKNLNVLEKAQAFQDYIHRFESSIEELARQLSMNRSTISNAIRLLELSEPVQQAVRSEKITAGHARALLSLDEADQIALCEKIQAKQLSVRKTEEAVRAVQKAADEPRHEGDSHEQAAHDQSPNNHILSLQEQLREHLGVKVTIRQRGEERGQIVLPFNSGEEFDHLLAHLRPSA